MNIHEMVPGQQSDGGALNGEKSGTGISGYGLPEFSIIFCKSCNPAVPQSDRQITDIKLD